MTQDVAGFSLDYFSLKGKIAIVTGGNKGLGQAYAVALAKAGADIFVIARSADWSETERLINETGQKATFFQADLSDRTVIKPAVEACLQEYGTVDILVNNAGTIRRSPLLDYEEKDWDAVMEINLNSLYLLSQEVAKVMVEKRAGKLLISPQCFHIRAANLFRHIQRANMPLPV